MATPIDHAVSAIPSFPKSAEDKTTPQRRKRGRNEIIHTPQDERALRYAGNDAAKSSRRGEETEMSSAGKAARAIAKELLGKKPEELEGKNEISPSGSLLGGGVHNYVSFAGGASEETGSGSAASGRSPARRKDSGTGTISLGSPGVISPDSLRESMSIRRASASSRAFLALSGSPFTPQGVGMLPPPSTRTSREETVSGDSRFSGRGEASAKPDELIPGAGISASRGFVFPQEWSLLSAREERAGLASNRRVPADMHSAASRTFQQGPSLVEEGSQGSSAAPRTPPPSSGSAKSAEAQMPLLGGRRVSVALEIPPHSPPRRVGQMPPASPPRTPSHLSVCPGTPPRAGGGSGAFSIRRPPKAPARVHGAQSASNPYRKASDLLASHRISIGGVNYTLTNPKSGCYKTTFYFAPMHDETEIFAGKKGKDLVAKAYSEERSSASSDTWLQAFTRNSLEQVARIKAHNEAQPASPLRFAEILNTPLEDGYFLCEKVPYAWEDKSIWSTKVAKSSAEAGVSHEYPKVEELPFGVQARLAEYREFVIWAFENNIDLDVQASNFRIDNEGHLVLIDFIEEKHESDETFAFLNTILKQISGGNEHVRDYLIEPLRISKPSVYATIKATALD